MIELDNRTSLNIDTSFLEKIASKFTDKTIELIIDTKDEIQKINKKYRGIDSSTDVLSFPYEDMPMTPLGSIIISEWHVKTVSNKLEHKEDEEFALLFIHALLHLLGYDHEVDNGEMRELEKELIEEFNLPKSLIIRTEEI